MNFKNIKKYLFSAAICSVGTLVFGQINVTTGYVYGETDVPIMDKIIQNYNDRNPNNSLQALQKMRPQQGIDIGVRHRWENITVDFNWITKFAQMSEIYQTGTSQYKTILYYKNQSFSLGTELYFGWFGIGATIDFNETSIRKLKTVENLKVDVISDQNWSNHIYLNIELPLNRVMSLSIKPYVQLPTRPVNFWVLENSLNPDVAAANDPKNYEQRIVNFGIALLFVNGPKN